VKVSFFQTVTEVAPFLHDLQGGWEELVSILGKHEFVFTHRSQVPLFSPAEFSGGRANANVIRLHFGVLDLDDVPTASFLGLLERWTQEGRAFYWYTTWSHQEADSKGLVRARVLVPFSRPVEPFEWPEVWKKLYAETDGLADPQCKDLGRCYFTPASPPGTEALALSGTTSGTLPFDVDAIGKALAVVTLAKKNFGYKQLSSLVATLKRSRNETKRWLREKLEALIAGESLAEPGDRDNTVWNLACAILDEFPEADPRKIAACFGPSLAVMERDHPGAPSLENVLSKLERKQTEKVVGEVVSDNQLLEEKRRRIRLAFGYSTRDTPYTQDELEAFTKSLELPHKDYLRSHWIVQKDQSYYILLAGYYQGPFTWAELEKAAQTYLAPAYSAGVETMKVNQWGEFQAKSAKELVEDYGTLARTIYMDFCADQTTFDPKTATVVEATCPLRVRVAEYSPEIAHWLTLLGGETHHKLLDWLSVVTRVNEPCAALYLEGAKGVGKSLLAEGVSRLWTDQGTVPLVDAMANFNQAVTRCPLVFADETVPNDYRGNSRTGELRQLIQARTRTLNRKYLAPATLRGSIRLVLAANNADLLHSNEHLTLNDIEAIVDRVVHVDATDAKEAQAYLEALPRATKDSWVEGDGIAKHCLWLRDNHTIPNHHRFLVSGDKSALHRRLTVSSGIRSAVCCWLVGYLMGPAKMDATGKLLARVNKGRLLVNVRALSDQWELYPTNVKPPAVGEIAKALVGISKAETVQLTDGTGTKTHYRVVDRDNLVSWASDYGFALPEAIDEALQKDTKVKP
jgi:hypothetical protein